MIFLLMKTIRYIQDYRLYLYMYMYIMNALYANIFPRKCFLQRSCQPRLYSAECTYRKRYRQLDYAFVYIMYSIIDINKALFTWDSRNELINRILQKIGFCVICFMRMNDDHIIFF